MPDPAVLTPVVRCGEFYLKREDLLTADLPGVVGGKYRLASALDPSRGGLVGYGGRQSNSAAAMAAAGRAYGVPVRFHTAAGDETPEMARAAELGAEILRHRPGYTNVIRDRAYKDAAARGWPCGLAHDRVVDAVARQVRSLVNTPFRRIVMAVGAGVTLAGVIRGLERHDLPEPILGVVVGAPPDAATLDRLAPRWNSRVNLVPAEKPYATAVQANLGGVWLHPIYEAKVMPFLLPGDLIWCVGTDPNNGRE